MAASAAGMASGYELIIKRYDTSVYLSESKLNINALNCRIDKHKMANISMGIDISNLEQLDNIMNKIKRMKGVYSVERMISNGQGG